MSDNIISLFGSHIPNDSTEDIEKEVNESITRVFATALEKAEAGDIHSFSLVYRDDSRDGDIVESWACDTMGDLAKLDHALGIMQHQFRSLSMYARESVEDDSED